MLEKRHGAAHLKKEGGWAPNIGQTISFIPARRPWQDKFNMQTVMTKSQHEISYFQNLRSIDHYVDQHFGNAMLGVETDTQKKLAYTNLLRTLEPSIIDWTIDNSGQDFISFQSVSGQFHRVGLVGEGVSNLFKIAFALFEVKQGDVLLFDEPELSLHPQAQKRLYEILRVAAQSTQIIVSTHSPYFFSWADIKAGARVYRTGFSIGDGATISTLRPETISKVAKVAEEKKNRKLYDVVAKEVFFSNGCLFVEGQEDAHIIEAYINENNRQPIEIFGYGSGGATHIQSWLSLADDLGVRAVALFDNDEAGRTAYAKCQSAFSGNEHILCLTLPTDDIRDKPPQGNSPQKLGLFDEAWILKSHHATAWNSLLDQIEQFLRTK